MVRDRKQAEATQQVALPPALSAAAPFASPSALREPPKLELHAPAPPVHEVFKVKLKVKMVIPGPILANRRVSFEHQGVTYYATLPDGLKPGDTFCAQLTLVRKPTSQTSTAHPTSQTGQAMVDAAVVVILEEGSVGQPHRVHRVFDKKQRLNAPAAAAWALGSFSIGRGGPVSLRIEQPHISATQCTILPPTPERPTWRLADFSTNGTLVNGTLVGKGNAVEIHDGDTINFLLRPYPYAIFRERFDDAVTEAAAAAAPGAPAAALAASAAGAKKRCAACASHDEVDILQDLRASLQPFAHTAITETTGSTHWTVRVEHNPHSSVGMPLYNRFTAARAAAADGTLRLAFHGTKAANIGSIFENSLDPSRRGQHGQKFGAGEYCASRLSTSLRYCEEPDAKVNKVVVLAVLAEGAKVHNVREPWGEIIVVSRPEHLVPIALIEVPIAAANAVLERTNADRHANHKRKVDSEHAMASRILTRLRRGDVSDASELYNSTEEVREGGRPAYAFQIGLLLEQDGLDKAIATALFPGTLDAIAEHRGDAGPSTSLPARWQPPAVPVRHAPLVKTMQPSLAPGQPPSAWLYRQH